MDMDMCHFLRIEQKVIAIFISIIKNYNCTQTVDRGVLDVNEPVILFKYPTLHMSRQKEEKTRP